MDRDVKGPGDTSVRQAEYAEEAGSGNGKETPSYARELVKNYIGGKWVEGSAGKTFESRNPATGELLGVLTVSDRSDVDKAVKTAEAAFKKWRLVPAPHRGEILLKCTQMLMERKEDLARLMTQEMGKVLAEARGDVHVACSARSPHPSFPISLPWQFEIRLAW
jgi:hypothetical protein